MNIIKLVLLLLQVILLNPVCCVAYAFVSYQFFKEENPDIIYIDLVIFVKYLVQQTVFTRQFLSFFRLWLVLSLVLYNRT